MPQLGMGIQALVNSWVKVNNKHVVFPGANGEGGSFHGIDSDMAGMPVGASGIGQQQQQQSRMGGEPGMGSNGAAMSGGAPRRHVPRSASSSSQLGAAQAQIQPVVGDGRTMLQQRHAPFPTSPALRSRSNPPANLPPSASAPAENSAPSRTNRQGKRIWGKERRLSRSNSQSDLVRSMATQRIHHPPPAQQQHQQQQDEPKHNAPLHQHHKHAKPNTNIHDDEAITSEGADASLRCAAGFIYGDADGTHGEYVAVVPHGHHQNNDHSMPQHYYHRPLYPPNSNATNNAIPYMKQPPAKQQHSPLTQPFPHPPNSYKVIPTKQPQSSSSSQQPLSNNPPTLVGGTANFTQNIPINQQQQQQQHIPYDHPHYVAALAAQQQQQQHLHPNSFHSYSNNGRSHHSPQVHPAPVSPMPTPPMPAPQPPSNPHHCLNCTEMEKYIFAVEADLEYLRSIALRNEFICVRCCNNNNNSNNNNTEVFLSDDKSVSSSKTTRKNKVVKSSSSVGSTATARKKRDRGHGNTASRVASAAESMSLKEASQRLVDVTARHKRQIEQMTKETARWQNDMHLKLSKFALMCKDLNEESSKRKNDATIATQNLLSTKTERDALSSEIEILKARVQLYEQSDIENVSLREMLKREDRETLEWADEQVKRRDDIITDLSGKLEQTLDTLQMERQQQRIRRQIIFPVGRSSSMGSYENDSVTATTADSTTTGNTSNNNNNCSRVSTTSHHQPSALKEMKEQLVKAKDEARAAQAALEASRENAARKEEELRVRVQQLERQLHDSWQEERKE